MENEFSGFFNTGIMDSEFRPLWSDYSLLFRRMSMGSKRLKKRLESLKINHTLEHSFRSDGIRYRVFVTPLKNRTYVCRIANDFAAEELEIKEIRPFIENVRASAVKVISLCSMIKNYADRTQYVDDEFHRYLKKQQLSVSSISADCHNLLNAFDSNLNNNFLPLDKYLLRTWDIMQFSTRKIGRTFKLHADFIYPYVKIDYSKLELAFYNLVKLALLYSIGEVPKIKFRTISDDKIEVATAFKIRSDFSLDNCELELRALKHIFRNMGGHFEVFEERGMIHARGVAEADFSCDENDVPEDMMLVYVGTPAILKKKKTSDRYIHIFEYAKKDKLRFASEVTELSDIEDEDIRFAEMFFSKVFLEISDSQ